MPHLAGRDRTELGQIVDSLRELTERIDRLEKYLGIQQGTEPPAVYTAADEERLELRFGEYGLAWAGSSILLLGIIFLMAYTQTRGYSGYASAVGYTTAIGLYAASRFWRQTIPHLSRLMAAGTTLLLYYSTLRLHFFTNHPTIGSRSLVLVMLGLVVTFQFYLSASLRSQAFAAMGTLLAGITALLADQPQITFLLIIAASATDVWMSLRFGWKALPMAAVFLIYATHLMWLLNNPLAGHPVKLVSVNRYNLIYLLVCGAILAWPTIRFRGNDPEEPLTVTTTILNCVGFFLVAAAAILFRWISSAAILCLLIACFFLSTSILQWKKTGLQLYSAIFASFGFFALSASVAFRAPFPTAFFWLALQSLLVLSMALWFRSKTLVVVNSVIYSVIFLSYIFGSPPASYVNFTFAFVALLSARILNWQRERLTLETALLRNFYLAIGFILILFSLYQAVPDRYVTLSWTAAAVGYFFLSYLLNNRKYRWMGTLALGLTVFYLLVIDLPRLEIKYRIVAFIFFGLMALIISLFYTKIRHMLAKTDR